MQKIEELTLYILQQEETIQELRKEVEQLKKGRYENEIICISFYGIVIVRLRASGFK